MARCNRRLFRLRLADRAALHIALFTLTRFFCLYYYILSTLTSCEVPCARTRLAVLVFSPCRPAARALSLSQPQETRVRVRVCHRVREAAQVQGAGLAAPANWRT
jgi:hypothetical protein